MQPVFSFTSAQLSAWTVAFLWPFVRILALLSTAPLFSEKGVQARVRLLLAMALTLVISPAIGPLPQIAPASGDGLVILAQQVLIGSAMGLSIKMLFAGVQAAGDYIGLAMGLSFAAFYDMSTNATTVVLSSFLNVLAILLFLVTDTHLAMLGVLMDSFRLLPIGAGSLSQAGWHLLAERGAIVFMLGLSLALPVMTALLAINLAMGILNRAAPQLSIFSVGFPITLFAGITLLQLMLPKMAPFLQSHMIDTLSSMAQIFSTYIKKF